MVERTAVAFQTDFDAPETVSDVYAPALPADGDDEFEDHEDDDLMFMIEQEHCFNSPDGTHSYLNGSFYCAQCGTAHPSIRNAGCGQR